MCVILYKPIGKVIRANVLNYCFKTNPHGAGYMYPKDDKVIIKKGFMSFHELMESVRDTVQELGGSSKQTPVVFHFRISTQGGITPELTHPYPICSSYDEMKQLSSECDIAMAHNGILYECANLAINDHNDTMEFIRRFANPIIDNNLRFFDDKTLVQELSELSIGSRLIFMTKNGDVLMTGNWHTYEGCHFSHPVFYKTYLGRPVRQPKPVVPTYKPNTGSSYTDPEWLAEYLKSFED